MSQVELTTLGKSCEFFNGKAHEKSTDENGKYIVVNSKFISSEGKSFKRTNEQMFPLYKGDIVMVMSDVPNGKALAKCFIIDKDDTYSLNQRICCIRSKEFDTKYLYYQLNRNEHFLAFNNGENQTNLRKDDILACPLIKPSMDEQKRMVAELDVAFSEMEKAYMNIEKNITNSIDLFKSELYYVFNEVIEGDWVQTKLGDVIDIINGKNQQAVQSENGKYPIFGSAGNLMGLANDFICQSGTTIIGRKGNISKPIYVNERFWNVDTAFGFYPKNGIQNKFVYFICLNIDFEKYNRGTTIPSLVKTELKNIIIRYPKSEELQKSMIRKLEALQDKTVSLVKLYKSKLLKLEELKAGVMKRAFENELIEPE
ncbi:MAG: restriction endonuclease subunit S [Bacteroidetes bacterium]|nr:restriction endonuclease subunit S [Bacteroidota bacterium]